MLPGFRFLFAAIVLSMSVLIFGLGESSKIFMVAIGVYFLPLDLWIKGYLAMGIVMLIQSCVTLTKTVRDMHESGKLVNRIEDAKAERILMDFNKAA